ncbi:MAG: Lrp/AsnC ligand binding domain-containing protein [Desulfocapsaceae bacterium]|jgi:DNA-binding Lrp family transcriptional regulator|nr:Lrp/AsnC ligand binding domain-containing protein [Desulfocapsaceae bacterium]
MNLFKKIFSRPKPQPPGHNPRFEEVREEEEAFTSIDRGTSLVPLDLIVGSVGRYHDFDARFSPKSYRSDERLRTLTTAMSQGHSIPPISLYQIKDNYYILDGHHRFTAAKNLGHDHIRACILELLPSKDTLENKLYIEKIGFRDRFKLTKVPELTEPGQYHYLNEQIMDHYQFLSTEAADSLTPIQAAADWYQTIYLPLKRLIEKSGLIRSFKNRTVDDLYLYISLHQWKFGKSRQYGIGVDKLIPKNMEEFRKKMKEHKEQEYPEMKREIIAFILMNVEGRQEEKIMDKLEALEEVREAHSVHGSIDIIIRVRLVRDLLSSDAELISQFLTSTIRQWNGVISTQTLLPGVSKIKDTR